jgi:hypothetical protein
MKLTWIIAVGVAASLFITGCEQTGTDIEGLDENVTLAEEEVADLKSAEATDSDVCSARFAGHLLQGGMMIGGNQLFLGNGFPPCATVTVDSDDFPKTITINYAEGCTGRMGLQKKGIVTIFMSDTILNEGAVYTVTYENMVMGQRTISKTATFTNLGPNENDNWVISFELLSTTTFERNGEPYTIVRELSGEREWIEGFDTPQVADDIFLLSGSGNITVNSVLTFEKTITEPLLIDRACRFPLSGIIEITRNDEIMTIDFGTGECDNIALVTKDGVSEEIELDLCKFRKGFQRHDRNMDRNKGWW